MSYAEKAKEFRPMYTPDGPLDLLAAFAEWLDQEAAQAAMGDKPAPPTHSCPMPSSEGDEYVCRHPLCGRRWGKDEEKPPCPLV